MHIHTIQIYSHVCMILCMHEHTGAGMTSNRSKGHEGSKKFKSSFKKVVDLDKRVNPACM